MATPKPLIELGIPFIHLLQVDSTNNYALNLVKNHNATNGTAVFTDFQTNGRGQMNKDWNASANNNVLTSVILDISTVQLQNQFYILAIAALSCIDFLKENDIKNAAIKWSNDIFINDIKAGGILIETCTHNNKRWAVVGIGLNINETNFNDIDTKATSLKKIIGKEFNVIACTKKIYAKLNFWYNQLLNKNYNSIHKAYNQHLFLKNKKATFKKGNIKFDCVVKCVNTFGELEVENCIYDKFSFGEIQLVM